MLLCAQALRRNSWLLIRLALGIGLFAVVAVQVDWRDVGRVVSTMDPAWIIAAVLVCTLDRVVMAGKWCYLLRRLGVAARLRDTVHCYYWGRLIGIALQWSLGGDVARGTALGRLAGKTGPIAASIIIEKLAGLAALGCVVVATLPALESRFQWLSSNQPHQPLLLIAAGVLVLAMIPSVGAWAFAGRAFRWAAAARPQLRQKNWFTDLDAALVTRHGLRWALVAFFAMTLFEQGLTFVYLFLVGKALELPITMQDIVVVTPTVLFMSRLPVSVEALGVYEGMFFLLARFMGLSGAQGIGLALTERVVALGVILLGLVVLLPAARLLLAHYDRMRGTAPGPLQQA